MDEMENLSSDRGNVMVGSPFLSPQVLVSRSVISRVSLSYRALYLLQDLFNT